MGHGEPEFNLREKADYGGKNIVHAGCWGTCPQKALRCPALRWSSWDSQSVKTTERGGTRGFDGHKWVNNVAVSRVVVVLHDIAGPPDVPDIQKVRAEEAGATTVILMPNCSTSVATDSERASTANFGAP